MLLLLLLLAPAPPSSSISTAKKAGCCWCWWRCWGRARCWFGGPVVVGGRVCEPGPQGRRRKAEHPRRSKQHRHAAGDCLFTLRRPAEAAAAAASARSVAAVMSPRATRMPVGLLLFWRLLDDDTMAAGWLAGWLAEVVAVAAAATTTTTGGWLRRRRGGPCVCGWAGMRGQCVVGIACVLCEKVVFCGGGKEMKKKWIGRPCFTRMPLRPAARAQHVCLCPSPNATGGHRRVS